MQRYNVAFKKYIKMSNMDIKHRMFYKMFAVVNQNYIGRFYDS